jgi:hypothetical protein
VIPRLSIVSRLAASLMACAIACGCSGASDRQPRNPQAPVSWAGQWEYTAPPANSAGGSPISMQYRLVVDDGKAGGSAQLKMQGFQTDQTIVCDVEPTDDRIVVKFRSYANGKVVNEFGVAEYRQGEPLLTLSRGRDSQKDSITTEWQGLQAPREDVPRIGVFFQKAALH